MAERPAKRQRRESADSRDIGSKRSAFLSSLTREVSPPRSGRQSPSIEATKAQHETKPTFCSERASKLDMPTSQSIPSPFKLTKVTGLSSENIDTISLHDILGDPLIKQAWIFNFCFDVDYTMRHFDADVRELVDVRIIHGSWKTEDGNRQGIEQALKTWKNVKEIKAYLPDAFGTHHSKMIILFKYDDTAQVIIHTANMLEKDWEHMTNAVWRSPILQQQSTIDEKPGQVGSGQRFKADLLRYIKSYGPKLKHLTEQLTSFDFSSIRAAIVASIPSRVKVGDSSDQKWGHLALRETLQDVYAQKLKVASKKHLVCQISSIASLPAKWLDETIYRAAGEPSKPVSASIIYPTQKDLQQALTGYTTGGSIHTKIESTVQQKQVSTLRPQLHRWSGRSSNPFHQAGRHLVPPHIKTYVCYTEKPSPSHPTPTIEWTLITSANLSKQAWGTVATLPRGTKSPDEATSHISSFEIGVIVWPELFEADAMVPTFGKDTPEPSLTKTIGIRMPYDLPLTPYTANEMPWSPSATYTEPDDLGQFWR